MNCSENFLHDQGQFFQEGTVSCAQEGGRLDLFLTQVCQGLTRNHAQNLIKSGKVFLNEAQVLTAKTPVTAGQCWRVCLNPEEVAPSLTPIPMNLDVRYEDEHLLVINKPAGLVVHPGAGEHQETLAQGVLFHCQAQGLQALPTVGGEYKPGLVHRLDKDTSGLMLVAKTNEAFYGLVDQFVNRTMDKRYWAFVWGKPRPAFGRLETLMGRDPKNRLKHAVLATGGRQAVTGYHTIAQDDFISLLECRLHTGRTHQIRVHCAYLGHPIIGDCTYQLRSNLAHSLDLGVSRQALHAFFLGFIHPISKKKMQMKSTLPEDLQGLAFRLDLEM